MHLRLLSALGVVLGAIGWVGGGDNGIGSGLVVRIPWPSDGDSRRSIPITRTQTLSQRSSHFLLTPFGVLFHASTH